jgi:hypothetical protein
MEEVKKLTYADFAKEIRYLCEATHNLEYHSGLYLTNELNKFYKIKKEVVDIYERYQHLSRRVHFIEIPESKHTSVSLTYTHKFKRVTSTKRLEAAFATLAQHMPVVLEVCSIADVIDGKVWMYERATEKRIYYTYTDGDRWHSDQMNVGVSTVIYTQNTNPQIQHSTEKKLNRLNTLNCVIDNGRGDYFKFDPDTKMLIDMLTI